MKPVDIEELERLQQASLESTGPLGKMTDADIALYDRLDAVLSALIQEVRELRAIMDKAGAVIQEARHHKISAGLARKLADLSAGIDDYIEARRLGLLTEGK